MPRSARLDAPGVLHHIMIRGIERRKIFTDDQDREDFLSRLEKLLLATQTSCFAWAFIPNHAHFLFRTGSVPIATLMRRLLTGYAVYFNHRHKRSGQLFQNRYKSILCQEDAYLTELVRYIHLNPVYIENLEDQEYSIRRDHLRSYLWSSYRGYAGLAKPFEMMTEGPILSLMETPKKKERLAYRRFVEAAIAKTDEAFLAVLRGSSWGIGGDDFQEHVRDLYADAVRQAKRPEDISFRLCTRKIDPETIIRLVAERFGMSPDDLGVRQYDCAARAVAGYLLVKYSGLNQRDIGERLGMGSGSAVSRQLKRLRERRETGTVLTQHIERLEKLLNKHGA